MFTSTQFHQPSIIGPGVPVVTIKTFKVMDKTLRIKSISAQSVYKVTCSRAIVIDGAGGRRNYRRQPEATQQSLAQWHT